MRSDLHPPKDDSKQYFKAHYNNQIDNTDSIAKHKMTTGRYAENINLHLNKASKPCA